MFEYKISCGFIRLFNYRNRKKMDEELGPNEAMFRGCYQRSIFYELVEKRYRCIVYFPFSMTFKTFTWTFLTPLFFSFSTYSLNTGTSSALVLRLLLAISVKAYAAHQRTTVLSSLVLIKRLGHNLHSRTRDYIFRIWSRSEHALISPRICAYTKKELGVSRVV